MITCDESGSIVVKVDGSAYDLSNASKYADFLLWATSPDDSPDDSPDEKVGIGKDTFKVDDDIPEEHRAKASRYATFLKNYASKRQDKLAKMAETLTTEQREKDIEAFIARLQSKEA